MVKVDGNTYSKKAYVKYPMFYQRYNKKSNNHYVSFDGKYAIYRDNEDKNWVIGEKELM